MSMKYCTCTNCGKTLSNRHTLSRHKKKFCKLSSNIITSEICEKKVVEKQPHFNEIIHFKSSEFKDGKPKTLEKLNKITELVNSELPPLLPAEKKIGMDTNTAIPAAPAIGFVDASVPGVIPGHPLHANELKEILKPIHPASIKSRQVVEQKPEKKPECKSNCSCKK